MKKFDRLSPEKRREEIRTAALELFCRKGFQATTMENIVEQVSLSKGGVYRIYPSTTAILKDLMIGGMHLRNAFYEKAVTDRLAAGTPLTLEFLVEIIGDSLLLYPEFSRVYVEFLWEKQRNPELQQLYAQICRESVRDTEALIRACHAEDLLLKNPRLLSLLTDLMNGAILSIHVLGLWQPENREEIRKTLTGLLKSCLEEA